MVEDCVLDAKSVLGLARLLQRGSLTMLEVTCMLPDAPEESLEALSSALGSCRTLKHLELRLSPHNGTNRRTGTQLSDALATLPALTVLDVSSSMVHDLPAESGRALGAVIAANRPSLRTLRMCDCDLGDDGVAALLAGLAANTHLRCLDCRHNGVSAAFERRLLTPALAALKARRDVDV
jgi:Ran GTPase-activating protein (RanGAP) involved in mRNA processing and transport